MDKIKGIMAFIGFLAVAAVGWVTCNTQEKSVTAERFEERHDILQQEVDSIKAVIAEISLKQDTVISDVRKIKDLQKRMLQNQDSIKAGQQAIFKHISNPKSNNDFLDEVLKFLE